MFLPSISVILPVYNVAPYLEACLDSLMLQTYQDFEVIAVNDGSLDESLMILEEYTTKISNLTIITQENRGLSAARNKGLKRAVGTFIYFLDSDDLLAPETFEICMELANRYTLDIVKFDAKPFSDDGCTMANSYDSSHILQEGKVYSQREWLQIQQKHYNSPVWLYIVRAEVIRKHQLHFVEGLLHEDEIFTPQLFTKATRMMYVAQVFFKRRYRSGSIMQNNIYQNKCSYTSKHMVIGLLEEERCRAITNEARAFLKYRRNELYMDSRGYDQVLQEEMSIIPKLEKYYLNLLYFIRSWRKEWQK